MTRKKNRITTLLTALLFIAATLFSLVSCSSGNNTENKKTVAEEKMDDSKGQVSEEKNSIKSSTEDKDSNGSAGTQPDTKTAGGEEKKIIYTSFFPVKNIAETVGGDFFEIRTFMPEDKEAHHWEPSARDIRNLTDAELFIVNGANLEFWLPDIKSSVPEVRILDLSEGLDLLTSEGAAGKGEFSYMASGNFKKGKYRIDFGHTHEKTMRMAFLKDGKGKEDEGRKIMEKEGQDISQEETFKVSSGEVYNLKMGHESGLIFFEIPEDASYTVFTDRVSSDVLSWFLSDSERNDLVLEEEVLKEKPSVNTAVDPHTFISLTNAKIYAERIYRELSKLSPENAQAMRKNRDEFIKGIADLEYEYTEKFKTTANKEFVVPHQAYGYLCREFGLTQFPLQGMTSMEDPDLKTISEAVNFCREKNIKTIFYEFGGSKKGAEAIAKETGASIAPLSTMEFISEEFKEAGLDYTGIMRMNLENIYGALK